MKNDETTTSIKKNKRIRIKKCFECGYTKFHYERKLQEISCLKCGLVLYSPPTTDFVTDGFKYE